jgi:hypothetical protein
MGAEVMSREEKTKEMYQTREEARESHVMTVLPGCNLYDVHIRDFAFAARSCEAVRLG